MSQALLYDDQPVLSVPELPKQFGAGTNLVQNVGPPHAPTGFIIFDRIFCEIYLARPWAQIGGGSSVGNVKETSWANRAP